ncbi:hypothetical protein S7335_3101 [Synechococcus sp. PCC 7335]|uniref:hypothetical protein n=1 Tax=Synechococcus sp. (strain ATCC 29403 / PCC 7335) TaxID=91464 RepID=UPI00017ED285|nr:hypothetical protein [Synechococcus sp. PCC 7335]EDX85400.1 hypothetical protein S7335_3101 [Synechococcus sp. PCC 7335]
MRFQSFVGRLTLSVFSTGLVGLFADVETVHAEPILVEAVSLSPAESSHFEAQRLEIGLSAIAQDINTVVEVRRQQAEDAAKEGTLDFADLPLIGPLLENGGKLSAGSNSPMSFSVGSVLGSYGVVMNADF